MRHSNIFPALVLCLVAAATTGARSALADITADGADDVCSLAADPCVVTEKVAVVAGSTLDFGRRAVVVQGNGQLDFGNGNSTLKGGTITIGGKGVVALASGNGGDITIQARRGCSGSPTRGCLRASDCDLGNCTGGSVCARDNTRACASNADCQLGTCSVGEGALSLTSAWSGRADSAGSASLEAADAVAVSGAIDVSGSGSESDGGYVDLLSVNGSVSVAAPISLGSGFFGAGGELSIRSALDSTIQAAIDCTGGDFDGGGVTVNAGRDALVSNDLNCNSVTGGGYGGFVDITASRDVLVFGGSGADRTVFSVFGHQSAENFAGEGGDIGLYAGRDIAVGQFASLISAGARPDAGGGIVTFDAFGMILIDGQVISRADGVSGDGGSLDLLSGDAFTVSSTGVLSVDGGNVGVVALAADGPVDLGGAVSMVGRQGGSGGSFEVQGRGEVTVRGTLTADKPSNLVDITGCRVVFEPGANYFNNSTGGINNLTGRESIHVKGGATFRTKTGASAGTNSLFYRDAAKPPLIEGTVTPSPVLVLSPALEGCPVCANFEVDEDETCDDGNTAVGDGCSADCQLESCIDQTVGGYPAQPLCNDGDGCTEDACNVHTGDCDHVFDCVTTTTTTDTTTTTTMPPASICGDANNNGVIQASDALVALRTAVGSSQCVLARCDANNNGLVQASDALAILRRAVGQPVTLNCPPA